MNHITENIINNIQKILNNPFRYKDLEAYVNKSENILIGIAQTDKIDKREFNASFDFIYYILDKHQFMQSNDNLVGLSKIGCTKIYNSFLESRTN